MSAFLALSPIKLILCQHGMNMPTWQRYFFYALINNWKETTDKTF